MTAEASIGGAPVDLVGVVRPSMLPADHRRRLVPLLATVAPILAAAGVLAAVSWWLGSHGPLDLEVYLWGGRAVTHDALLYQAHALGHWFTYPPFAAVMFWPLTLLPAWLAETLWGIGSLAALVFACRKALSLGGFATTAVQLTVVAALALLLEPVWHTLALGQINLFLIALVLWDIDRIASGRFAGFGIGVAAAIKLTPALFIVVLLLNRQRRSALVAIATFGAAATLGALVAPAASRAYWLHLFYDTSRVGAPYISNQSPFGVLARVSGGIGNVGGWYVVLPLALAGLGIVAASVFARRGDWLAVTATTGVTQLLVCPISWTHHWVWALPCLLVLIRERHRADSVIAWASYAVFALALPWLTPRDGGPAEYGWHWMTTLAADSYLLVGLVLLSRLAWLASRGLPDRGRIGGFPTHLG